jgi:diguanylate cyclase (GGDEF)-like protein/PAS domain S-box-containing protein
MENETCELTEEFQSPYLKQLYSATTGALVLCDINRQILAVNQNFTRLFLFQESECEGCELDDLITPSPFLAESESVFNTALSGIPVSLPTVKMKSDGCLISVFQIAVQINTDSHGRLLCYVFRESPVVSRQRSTDNCNDLELLSSFFENSCEPSVYTDSQGIVTRANSAFNEEFGWTAALLTGQSLSDMIIPQSLRPEAEYIKAMALAGRILRLRTMRKKKDNSTLHISLISSPAKPPFAQEAGYSVYRTSDSEVVTTADVTSRNRFRECASPGMNSGMFFHCRTDTSRTMEFLSPGSASFTGYSELDILSGEKPYGSIILSADLDMVLKTVQDSIQNSTEYNITYRIRNNFGSILWVMEQGRAYSMQGNAPDFCEGCVVDITETRRETESPNLIPERIEKLHGVAAELQRSRSAGDIYRICAEAGQSILNGVCSCIFLQTGDELELVASAGREQYPCSSGCSLGMAEIALSTSSPCYFRSRDRSDGFCPAGTSGVCFKLEDNAVFQLVSESSRVFGNVDTRILELLLGYTQQGLKRIALHHHLINQALHDPLTGIYNRNYFNRVIELEEHRARKLGSAIGFIMVDVDNFKQINDKYGHQAGDSVLQEVARVLQNSLRKTDTVLRYGGDEFLIILTRMSADYSRTVERRISKTLERSEKPDAIKGEPITVSMGHAYWTPNAEESIDDILRLADSIMFENKRNKAKTQ